MKLKGFLIGGFLSLLVLAKGQSPATDAYIRQYKDLAIAEMQRTGVPAAIKLAQAILESQSGSSKLALTANNHFGIKCKVEWTGGKVYQDDDEKGECFRVYPSVEQSFKDHSDFLRNRPYYASLFNLDPTDMQGWAYGLKKAGYATSKTYPQSLLKIIRDYNLEQYNTAVAFKTNVPPVMENTVKESTEKILAAAKEETGIEYSMNSFFPRGIFTINRSKVVFARAGTFLKDIVRQYDITQEELITYNDLHETESLQESRLIYLERRLKKSSKPFRIAQQGDTWKDISQLEGILLEHLLMYNQVTRPDTPIPAGQKIWLQPSSESNNNLSGTQ
jgi:hypothetical protein